MVVAADWSPPLGKWHSRSEGGDQRRIWPTCGPDDDAVEESDETWAAGRTIIIGRAAVTCWAERFRTMMLRSEVVTSAYVSVALGLPAYTEADIRQRASADSFQRGHEYCRSGAVESLVQRGTTLQADVLGSEVEPYRIQVTFDAERLAEAVCTCPYDWGGWCKHIVATLVAAREQPEAVEGRKPLAVLLAGLDRDQLQALLLALLRTA